jgi:hypothetical protein
MNNWCICWFSRIVLLWILIFEGLTARHLYKSFGVEELSVIRRVTVCVTVVCNVYTGTALTSIAYSLKK